MEYETAREEMAGAKRPAQLVFDVETLRLECAFVRAHGRPKRRLTTLTVTREQRREGLGRGDHLE